MARIRVSHSIGDLARDAARVVAKAGPGMTRVVRKNTMQGNKLAQGIARRASGPHGTNYYKRLTDEMTGPLTGEYGPTGTVAGNAVGGGWRNGPPNNDLPKSADVIGPRFAKDVGDLPERWFW